MKKITLILLLLPSLLFAQQERNRTGANVEVVDQFLKIGQRINVPIPATSDSSAKAAATAWVKRYIATLSFGGIQPGDTADMLSTYVRVQRLLDSIAVLKAAIVDTAEDIRNDFPAGGGGSFDASGIRDTLDVLYDSTQSYNERLNDITDSLYASLYYEETLRFLNDSTIGVDTVNYVATKHDLETLSPGSSYTFSQGVTESGGTVKFGGTVTESRTLTQSSGTLRIEGASGNPYISMSTSAILGYTSVIGMVAGSTGLQVQDLRSSGSRTGLTYSADYYDDATDRTLMDRGGVDKRILRNDTTATYLTPASGNVTLNGTQFDITFSSSGDRTLIYGDMRRMAKIVFNNTSGGAITVNFPSGSYLQNETTGVYESASSISVPSGITVLYMVDRTSTRALYNY